jgi:hypothetical protein
MASILAACGEKRVPNLKKNEFLGANVVFRGSAIPLPITSDLGTTISIRYPLGVGVTVAPVSYQHVGGTEVATVTAAPDATLGVQPIDVTGTNGVGARAKTEALVVNVYVVDAFSLSVTGPLRGRAGQVIAGVVRLQKYLTFGGAVSLTMQGQTKDWAVGFGQVQTGPTDFTMVAPATTPEGLYHGTVVGTSGGIVQRAEFEVEILPPLVSPDFSMAVVPSVLSIFPSGTATTDIRITRNSALTGNIALTVDGLPERVTPLFSPAPMAEDVSRLTLTSVNATPGVPVTVTVTGTGGGVTKTTTFSLAVVPVPNFTLTPAAATIVLQNPFATPGSVALNIVRTGQVGPVTLTASGVPPGVSAAFTASPAAGPSSTLVFAPTGTTKPDDYPIVVVGTADGITQSTQVILRVLPSTGDFVVKFGLPSFDLAQGTSALLVVNLNRTGTLVGSAIALSPSTVPPQASAVATPVSTTQDAAFINLSVGATAPIGAHLLAVTASGGGLTRTDSTVINITAPLAPGFRLMAIPAQFQFPRSTITPFAIGITRISGFAGTVTLSAVSPFPGNMLIEFAPLPSAPDVIRVNMYASANVVPGTYFVPFTGTSGALTMTIIIPIVVEP